MEVLTDELFNAILEKPLSCEIGEFYHAVLADGYDGINS